MRILKYHKNFQAYVMEQEREKEEEREWCENERVPIYQ